MIIYFYELVSMFAFVIMLVSISVTQYLKFKARQYNVQYETIRDTQNLDDTNFLRVKVAGLTVLNDQYGMIVKYMNINNRISNFMLKVVIVNMVFSIIMPLH